MVDSSDGRGFQRMTLDCPMIYRSGGSDQARTATAVDISSTGISFLADQSLRVGERLVVNVTPAQSVVAPLNARVEVIRVTPADTGKFEVACKIQEFLT